MAKIIQFPDDKVKYLIVHVTGSMLTGLIVAWNKQHLNIPFSKADLKDAFTPLYKNGFITVKNVIVDGKNKHVWSVTTLGKKILRTSGIKHVS